MHRATPLLVLLALGLSSGCASEFASQCDGLTEMDAQVACLDAGFQSLRSEQARCLGDDERERASQCYDDCLTERGWTEEACRLACASDDRGDTSTRTEDGSRTDDGSRATDGDRRDEDRAREDLDGLHLGTRGDVLDSERSGQRSRLIRHGLGEGEGLTRCR